MSHFVAMVVGDVEHNLAPFHEFECTGCDDEFVKDIDILEQIKSDYERNKNEPDYAVLEDFVSSYYGLTKVEFGREPDLTDSHKYGYFTVDEDGNVVSAINRTNPNKKWDWYVEGGRWSGYLLGKDGKRHDVLLKSEIDIEGMRDLAGYEAGKTYDEAMSGVSGTWETWAQCRDVMFTGEVEKAREFYHAQPQIVQIGENLGTNGFFFKKDDLLVGREKYVQAARDSAIAPLAFVQDRNWYERGSMGWFGCVSDEKNADDWNAEFSKAFEALPDDAVISIIDCHI